MRLGGGHDGFFATAIATVRAYTERNTVEQESRKLKIKKKKFVYCESFAYIIIR